jgi:hypothetical protein
VAVVLAQGMQSEVRANDQDMARQLNNGIVKLCAEEGLGALSRPRIIETHLSLSRATSSEYNSTSVATKADTNAVYSIRCTLPKTCHKDKDRGQN